MADLETIFQEVAFAETVEHTILLDGSELKVTIAEANPMRNRRYQRALFQVVLKEGVVDDNDLSREAFIRLVAGSLLRGWGMKRDGAPVPVSEAVDILTANADKGGFEICTNIELIARQPQLFKQGPSKKKTSSATTRRASRSATKRTSSKPKPKRAASRSRRASKAS